MMKRVFARLPVVLTVLSLLCAAGGAQAIEFVTNGGFELTTLVTTPSFFLNDGNGILHDWTVGPLAGGSASILFAPGDADSLPTGVHRYIIPFDLGLWGPLNSPGPNSTNGLTATSPSGGNFVAEDSDVTYSRELSQNILGLHPGISYTLSFQWAAAQFRTAGGGGFNGLTNSKWQVSIGSQVVATTPVASIGDHGFSGWKPESYTFTLPGATGSDVLRFFAIGNPGGLPPVALLDGVSLVGVPEPSSLLIVGIGLFGSVLVGRLRRAKSGAVQSTFE